MSSESASNNTPSSSTELAALISSLQTMAHAAVDSQTQLSRALLGRLIEAGHVVPVPSFVEGVPATPAEVAATTPVDQEAQTYWVVLRGREPGLYRTVRAANDQTHGVPGQFQQRKSGRDEALAFYTANYPANVKKWVPIEAPVPAAEESEAMESDDASE
ncbi:hypothetical protein B0H11DRAFT_2225399 [Mycena galericulata]|nr:hypothetical protein B0H11DRAFT_1919554 [Mycena galericulata]KAJ7500399.1 hypothetical protein B0H11DRAFT_2225399 [Mycena galericulata]